MGKLTKKQLEKVLQERDRTIQNLRQERDVQNQTVQNLIQQIAVRDYLLNTAVYALITNAINGRYNAGAGVERSTYDAAFAFLGAGLPNNDVNGVGLPNNGVVGVGLTNNGVNGVGLQNAPANLAAVSSPPAAAASPLATASNDVVCVRPLTPEERLAA